MKKNMLLTLHRETLRHLSAPLLRPVAGGITQPLECVFTAPGSCYTCGFSCIYSACPGDTDCECPTRTN